MQDTSGRKPGGGNRVHAASAGAAASAPGKRTLSEQLPGAAGEARAAVHGTPAVAEGEDIYLGASVDRRAGRDHAVQRAERAGRDRR